MADKKKDGILAKSKNKLKKLFDDAKAYQEDLGLTNFEAIMVIAVVVILAVLFVLNALEFGVFIAAIALLIDSIFMTLVTCITILIKREVFKMKDKVVTAQ